MSVRTLRFSGGMIVQMILCDFLHQGNNGYGNIKREREALTSLTFDTENDALLMVQSGET